MDQINEILSSLSDEDMDSLKSLANSIFGSNPDSNNNSNNSNSSNSDNNVNSNDDNEKGNDNSNNPFDSIDPEMLKKIGIILRKLNAKKDDDRIRLIKALKPLLSDKRKKKADEAIKMMSIFELLPELKNLNIL